MSTIAIMQPTFFPWLGYFELINKVDKFVFLDNVEILNKVGKQEIFFSQIINVIGSQFQSRAVLKI